MSSRPLLLAITTNQTLTEKALTRRGHPAQVASETRIQTVRGKQVERQVNLLGGTIAISEPDDYRQVLDSTGIICLVAKPTGDPLMLPAEDWDAWLAYMEEERRTREAERQVKKGPPCAVGDRVVVKWSADRIEEGICEWIGKKYLRITPLQGSGNVITAPFSLVAPLIEGASKAADRVPSRSQRRRKRRNLARQAREARSSLYR